MGDYIEREWFLDVVENIIQWDTERDRNRIIHQVRELTPAADVRENKRGKWIFGVTMHHEWMKCSACNVSQDLNGCFSYCPNCGADMREDNDG